MALVLFVMRQYFYYSDYFGKILELSIMIASGLLVYAVSAYLSGSLNILLKSHLLKRKKDDIIKAI
jgi:hypothetical protein